MREGVEVDALLELRSGDRTPRYDERPPSGVMRKNKCLAPILKEAFGVMLNREVTEEEAEEEEEEEEAAIVQGSSRARDWARRWLVAHCMCLKWAERDTRARETDQMHRRNHQSMIRRVVGGSPHE
jgi:hypothetical protein